MKNRLRIKITGESGQGINVTGDLLAKSLKNSGYFVLGYREYPSLIKGGHSSYQVEVSDQPINATSSGCELLISLSRVSLHKYFDEAVKNAIILHTLSQLEFTEQELKQIERKNLKVHYIDVTTILKKLDAPLIAQNVFMCALAWQILDLPLPTLLSSLQVEFASKPEALQKNLLIATSAYEYNQEYIQKVHLLFKVSAGIKDYMYITGNEVLAMGAIASGVRAVYGYPMTPASSILSFLANTSSTTGIVFKQAEDEITAVQMALGSMFAGTRALTATSGGGFDLMTETISLAAITETPLVVVLAQRPGPSTGMPTWTAGADLMLAVYGGHGEYAKCVIAIPTAAKAYELTALAFNIAEQFQIPVILLTDKYIAESGFTINPNFVAPTISRGLTLPDHNLTPEKLHRYAFTKTGVSPRWLPGSLQTTYTANSDEHDENGAITEDAEPASKMLQKRLSKLNSLLVTLPEPELTGNPRAKFVLVTWGSTYSAVTEALGSMEANESAQFQHLNFTYVWPLRTSLLEGLIRDGKQILVIEQNQTAQLASLLKQQINFSPVNMLLKFDGRPLWVQEIVTFLNSYL